MTPAGPGEAAPIGPDPVSDPGKVCIWTVRPGTGAPFCGLRGAGVRKLGPSHEDVPGARIPMRLHQVEVTLCRRHLALFDDGKRDTD